MGCRVAKHSQEHKEKHTSCYKPASYYKKSVQKLLTSCVRIACSKLLEQVWNKLLTTRSKLDGTIRLCHKVAPTRLILEFLFNLDELQRNMREIFIEIRTIQEITEELVVTPRAKHDVVVEQKVKVRNNPTVTDVFC